MRLRIRAAAKALGVSQHTLTRWRRKGLVKAHRFGEHGHWVFDVEEGSVDQTQQLSPNNERISIIYVRVSTRKQIPHLKNQIEILQQKYPTHRVIKDVGSGLNFKRKGLLQILELSLAGQVREVCVTHKDRLCRFAYDLLEHIFKRNNTKIRVDAQDNENETSASNSNESELAEDILSIITVFGAKLHGARSGAVKRAKKEAENKKGKAGSQ